MLINGKDYGIVQTTTINTRWFAKAKVVKIDWGIAIRSTSDTQCKIESFKTRDAAPFEFHAQKKYSCMKIIELAEDQAAWDNIKI